MAERKRKTKKRKRAKNDYNCPPDLLPTGCTLLNCAFSDNPFGGFRKGKIVNIVGDSSAGKSILCYTSLAAIASDPAFDNYRLIVDDAECADSFDVKKLFGKKLLDRLEPPGWKNDEPIHSETVQDFLMMLKDAVNENKPFVYILDSWDAVDSEEDQKHLDDMYKNWKKDRENKKGTYGTAKAKMASTILRNIKSDINKTQSVVVIVSQVRENLNAGMFGSKKTRSGGKALKHYSWQECWLYLGSKIKHPSTKLPTGVTTYSKTEKNRQTGKLRDVEFTIFYDLGIDDVAANIKFLDSVNYLKKKKQTYVIPELDFEGTKDKLIAHIEDNNLEKEVQRMVGEAWKEREDSIKLSRKKRFE